MCTENPWWECTALCSGAAMAIPSCVCAAGCRVTRLFWCHSTEHYGDIGGEMWGAGGGEVGEL